MAHGLLKMIFMSLNGNKKKHVKVEKLIFYEIIQVVMKT